jgi:hypothetical protein
MLLKLTNDQFGIATKTLQTCSPPPSRDASDLGNPSNMPDLPLNLELVEIQVPLERPTIERVLPDLDTVSLALEAAFAASSTSVRVHNDQLDARALMWALFAIYSPVSKVEAANRCEIALALAEHVFPGVPSSIASNIHLRSLALNTPQAFLYLLHEQRKMHFSTNSDNLSDYSPSSRWKAENSFDSWKIQDLKRIGNIDRLLNGDSTLETFPSPILIVQLFQARHISYDKNSHPKSITVTLSFEMKSGRSEKRKMVGIATGEFGTSTNLDSTPFILPFSLESHKKLRNSTTEEQVIEHWKQQQATLLIKVRNGGANSKVNNTTIGKARIPLADIFEKYRGNLQAASEAHWITLGALTAPEVLLKTVFVLPSDHLRLEACPISLGTTYARLSNRLHTTQKNVASLNSHAILDSFASFFGIGPIRVQLASLESLLLFGDTRVAYDRMMRHIQSLDEIEKTNSKNGENLPMTLAEASLYKHLRPSVQKYAISLVCNCIEAFPDNYPSGALRRAIQMARHFSSPGVKFTDELATHLRVGAKKAFYQALYPHLVLDEALIAKQISENGIRDQKMPYPLESFATIAKAISMVRKVVAKHEQYYSDEFKQEIGMDSTSIYVEVFVEMLSRTLEWYFLEGHPELRRERRGSVGKQAEAEAQEVMEHRLVFQSVDAIRWIVKHWQAHTKVDLNAKIPIYDYLEHGTRWWLESLDTQMQRWAAEVLLTDDFEPLDVGLNLLHSQSVIHLFSISHEALGVITPVLAKWTKPSALDHLEYFVRCFCKSAEMYCMNVEVMFTQQTSSERVKSRVPSSNEEKRVSQEKSSGKKQKFAAPVAVKSLFAPILRSTKFNQVAGKMQGILRITEDPSQLLPQEQRFQVTRRICVQMNNVDTVRTLINERAEMLYNLYETILEGPLKSLSSSTSKKSDQSVTASKGGKPNSCSNEEKLILVKQEMEDWIADRFQHSLRSIRSVSEGLVNELCSGLLIFIESMLFFIVRMYRSEDDGKVRNEGNRLMSKLTSKGSVSAEEVSQEMEPVFEFLDDTVEALSKHLHYDVFKRLVKCLWMGIAEILEDALLPHAEKHLMKPDQISKLLCIDLQLKEYFTYDGESLPETIAEATLHEHQLVSASLSKPAKDIIEMMQESKSKHLVDLLTRLLKLKAEKDSYARDWVRQQDLRIQSR